VNGFIPRVVFSCGEVEIRDKILVYYGGADIVISLAELNKRDIEFD